MKKIYSSLVALALTVLLTTLLAGCGGNGGGESQPAPPQTGDATAFPNAALLASPTAVDTSQAIVLDARHTGYDSGHIPGAIAAPPSLFSETNGELLPIGELEKVVGALGITRTSKIIIYDNTTESLGAAGRLFWMLEYLGCTDVTILNGGWDQWVAQDREIQTAKPANLGSVEFTAQIVNTISVTKDYVAGQLPPNQYFALVDVRTEEEFLGTQPDNTDPRPGHITGAISFPYAKCFNPDKTVLNFNDLKLLLATYGITANKEVVAYSTVGKRSGFFYFLCRLMGYPRVLNYAGSIVDWGNAGLIDPVKYPMVTGP